MTNAYDRNYLERARISLGRMLDYAVYDLKYDLTAYWELFLNSPVAKQFERGEASILVGKSGVELALMVIGKEKDYVRPVFSARNSFARPLCVAVRSGHGPHHALTHWAARRNTGADGSLPIISGKPAFHFLRSRILFRSSRYEACILLITKWISVSFVTECPKSALGANSRRI